jgi:acetyl esterase/lipase
MQTKAALDPILKPWMLDLFAQMYLNHANPRHPLASPLYADLSGLPPLLIQVGSSEILIDDAHRLAKRAKEAEIEVELQIWDNMIHMWHFFATNLSEGREAIARIGKFIATACT